ncbi:DsbA family protein [Pasteurella atlantica]|uniref:DsbA family protein n=1 Tax=Pasteurellaceae TaxID=712 RepID=UPI00276499FE|nr:DsbA family protein [Pasteurella atlantica]MDP8034150.1 DsbA family protein [Pasteurella atlantica]MDP8036071.1 DsbA family protein [Pasteurella atlantica]MDP8038021.1 DsbA family protein [Pasteurella atlantica]MDP8048388.1 DsbA family protein [Pasteurella atlantica]MDP8050333.1 DsbA family protein [Pasteurella atlantica]
MKKLLKIGTIVLLGLVSFNATAFEPKLGKEYVEISQLPVTQKEVVEFFSFYCPHCKNFEITYKIPTLIKEKLPENIPLTQYHLTYGPQGENLTRAWALAMALNVEDSIKIPLFNAVQEKKINSMEDIRSLFVENGVSEKQFDGGINSFAINGLVAKQENLAKTLKVEAVPAFFVDNKYKINGEGFSDVKTTEEFIQHYVDTITSLATK